MAQSDFKIEIGALDEIGEKFMALFPDREPRSLDEFLLVNHDLPDAYKKVGYAIMALFPEYGGENVVMDGEPL